MKTENEKQLEITKAIKVLADAMNSDHQYFYAWQANIAMAFQDEFNRELKENSDILSKETLHRISNMAAVNFLALLSREAK
jgi:hypothetical protein